MEIEKELQLIVHRCKNGERAAFEELFDIYQPRLKYYVRRLDGGTGSADDTLQDVWLTVFRKIKKLKDVRCFNVWLYRIARNKVYDRYRKKDRFVTLPEDNELPVSGCDEPVFDAEDTVRLHQALNKLKPYHREVLTLCFIERVDYKSIAEIVECNVGTVRSRIYYAKQSLRKEMEKQNG